MRRSTLCCTSPIFYASSLSPRPARSTGCEPINAAEAGFRIMLPEHPMNRWLLDRVDGAAAPVNVAASDARHLRDWPWRRRRVDSAWIQRLGADPSGMIGASGSERWNGNFPTSWPRRKPVSSINRWVRRRRSRRIARSPASRAVAPGAFETPTTVPFPRRRSVGPDARPDRYHLRRVPRRSHPKGRSPRSAVAIKRAEVDGVGDAWGFCQATRQHIPPSGQA